MFAEALLLFIRFDSIFLLFVLFCSRRTFSTSSNTVVTFARSYMAFSHLVQRLDFSASLHGHPLHTPLHAQLGSVVPEVPQKCGSIRHVRTFLLFSDLITEIRFSQVEDNTVG